MLRGSCLRGGVRYEISGPLRGVLNCHCSMCRKAHGAAFRTRASVKAADFRWVQGEELITYYESSPGNHRGFCRVCADRPTEPLLDLRSIARQPGELRTNIARNASDYSQWSHRSCNALLRSTSVGAEVGVAIAR